VWDLHSRSSSWRSNIGCGALMTDSRRQSYTADQRG
jgi:hypothetical protein